MDRRLLEYRPEIEGLERPASDPGRAPIEEEARAAVELLEHLDQGELDHYLVDLIDRAGPAADGRVTRTLVDALGRAARRVLRRGDAPPAAAGRILGLELEGLSPEDQVFEVARHFVRFASEAARQARSIGRTGAPSADARRAFVDAARSLAPGLVPPTDAGRSMGRWVRRANDLIVLDP